MFNQRVAGEMLGMSDTEFRNYADSIGIKAEKSGRNTMVSIGDMCLVRMARDLVERGYSAHLATSLVFAMKGEFHRLVVDEGRGAAAWLVWRLAPEVEGAIEATIYRDAGDALEAMNGAPDAAILPIHTMLRIALDALLAEVGTHA